MMTYYTIRSSKTACWFCGFYFIHPGTEKQGTKMVEWSTINARIVWEYELQSIQDDIAEIEGIIRLEVFKLVEGE